jgi:hypothetical protein
VTVLINHFCLYNIEYLFRIYIATLMAFPFVAIDQINTFFEVYDSVNRVTVINLKSSIVQDQQFIEHLKMSDDG